LIKELIYIELAVKN